MRTSGIPWGIYGQSQRAQDETFITSIIHLEDGIERVRERSPE